MSEITGRIIKTYNGYYYVLGRDGVTYTAKVRGRLIKARFLLAAGDWVTLETRGEEGMIETILPRRNLLQRPLVANLDWLFAVFAAKDPAPSFLLIDKLLALAEAYDIPAALVINKCDLAAEGFLEQIRAIYEPLGYPVYFVEARKGKGLDPIRAKMTGLTSAFGGPSGAGKTTMCNLIARFWDVNAGKITIGGTDVRDFKLDSLMKNISMVFQSVYLFADTIENNIKFGCPDATHEQVVEAAKKACCHDFISALPDGYDTVIGEGGGTLSGGEKQRISIARAMLKDAPIIILDEATSSVDPENEDELQRAIEALTHDKTIIMIAHRLKTVRNADQILVLDNAHIVQRGTHAELIKQKGLYADFVSARQEAIGWKLAQ